MKSQALARIQAGPDFGMMQKNSVGEPTSPALAEDSIYIRSDRLLFRIREGTP